MIIDVFYPCIHDGFTPQNRENLLKILAHVGDQASDVIQPLCCGQKAYLSGYPQLAKSYGEIFVKRYEANRPLITASTSCLGYMRKYYTQFFFNTSLHNELKQFQANSYDITQYLVNVKKQPVIGAEFEGIVSYYKTCSASQKCNLENEAEILLKNVSSLTLTDYKSTNCCGSGGKFPTNHPEFAEKLARIELQLMMDKGTQYITATDAQCLAHFQKIIDKHKFSIKTIHIIDILASGY
jgi:L-lactate dehydrogenase complex protein LldE